MTDKEKIDKLINIIGEFYTIYATDTISQTSNNLDLAIKRLYNEAEKIHDSSC